MKYLLLLIILLGLAGATEMLAHSSVRFHTGQTASYEAQAGEDADVDGTDK